MTIKLRKRMFNSIIEDNVSELRTLLEGSKIEMLEDIYEESLIASCGKYNAIKICKYLVSIGISLEHIYDEFDKTCLHEAVFGGHEELTVWLLKNGANPNGNLLTNSTPISNAIYMIERVLIKKLSEINNDPKEIEQGYGKTELIIDDPEYLKFKRIIIQLLENDADPNIMTFSSCKTPLDVCYYSNNQEIADILKKYGARYANLNIEDTDKKDNKVLLKVNENIGRVLSVYFKYSFVDNLELMISLIDEDYRLKLLITNGLSRTEIKSEIGFVVDINLPVGQQIIDDGYLYGFFEKLPLLIADQVYHSKLELFEGLIIEPNNFPELQFPNNLNALMVIKKEVDDHHHIWLLVPIKYPRSKKFTPLTLEKFVSSLKKKKWYRLAYLMEQG